MIFSVKEYAIFAKPKQCKCSFSLIVLAGPVSRGRCPPQLWSPERLLWGPSGTFWGSLLTLSLGFLCRTIQDCLEMMHIWVLSQQEKHSWIPHCGGRIYHCLFPLFCLSVHFVTNHNKTTSKCSDLPLFVVYFSNIICYFHCSKIKVCDMVILLFSHNTLTSPVQQTHWKHNTHPTSTGDQQSPINTEGKQEWSLSWFKGQVPAKEGGNLLWNGKHYPLPS